MKNLISLSLLLTVFLGGLALPHGIAHAISLSFVPAVQEVGVGTPLAVALVVSGLGDGTAPSLSAFDLDVLFDPLLLSVNSVAFGDPVLGDQLDLFGLGSLTGVTPGVGSVNLFALSFDDPLDLDSLQAESFTLATVTFDTLATGTSALELSINALGDAVGNALTAEVLSGSVTATSTPVPEPGSLLLLGSGLVGLVGWRKKGMIASVLTGLVGWRKKGKTALMVSE